jgi:hypothetical protein
MAALESGQDLRGILFQASLLDIARERKKPNTEIFSLNLVVEDEVYGDNWGDDQHEYEHRCGRVADARSLWVLHVQSTFLV